MAIASASFRSRSSSSSAFLRARAIASSALASAASFSRRFLLFFPFAASSFSLISASLFFFSSICLSLSRFSFLLALRSPPSLLQVCVFLLLRARAASSSLVAPGAWLFLLLLCGPGRLFCQASRMGRPAPAQIRFFVGVYLFSAQWQRCDIAP